MLWAKSAKKRRGRSPKRFSRTLRIPTGFLRAGNRRAGVFEFCFARNFITRELRDAGEKYAHSISAMAKKFKSSSPASIRPARFTSAMAASRSSAMFWRAYTKQAALPSSANITSTMPAIRWKISVCRSMARYRESFGEAVEFPEGGYPGDYVREIAAAVKRATATSICTKTEAAQCFSAKIGGESLLETHPRARLREFGIEFDSFFSEKAMRERGEVSTQWTSFAARLALYPGRRRVVSIDPIRRRQRPHGDQKRRRAHLLRRRYRLPSE